MKIAFIGCIDFSQRALELLIEMNLEVVGVCTLKKSAFNADHRDLGKIYQGVISHGLTQPTSIRMSLSGG